MAELFAVRHPFEFEGLQSQPNSLSNLNLTHYAIGLRYWLLLSDIRHGRHCVFALHVHLVFVTKYRRKVFDAGAIQRLKVMFEKVCTDFEAQLVEMNGEAEHVHLLIHYPPKHSVSSMVNSFKGISSRLLRIERPDIEKR
jgi:putative transposase